MTSPWRTTEQAAIYLAFVDRDGQPDLTAFHRFMQRYIPRELTRKVGRSVRVHVDALEAALTRR